VAIGQVHPRQPLGTHPIVLLHTPRDQFHLPWIGHDHFMGHPARGRLNHGECVPTSMAIRQGAIFFALSPGFVVSSVSSLATFPASSKMQ
jgi:hypothetical protein